MKKLTTLFILVFLTVGLFAEPKVPKTYNGEDSFSYVSNDFNSCYEIYAQKAYGSSKKFQYAVFFDKKFFFVDRQIKLTILFENENQLDNFIKTIHLSDLENEFNRIRKQMIINDATPNATKKNFSEKTFDFNNPAPTIFYEIDGTKLKS